MTIANEPYLNLEDMKITLQADDPVYFTNGPDSYYLRVTLDDYVGAYTERATLWQPFTIDI